MPGGEWVTWSSPPTVASNDPRLRHMTSDLLFKTVNGIHGALLKATNGKIGGNLRGMPVLQLTTTGRKSGQPRTTVLTAPLHDGEQLVIVASRNGDDQNPAWLLNLREEPNVEVTMEGKTRPMTARIANATEKAELWPRIVAANPGYAGYQKK